MGKYAALIAVGLTACGPIPDTPCGMVLDGYLDGWLTAEDLRVAETELMGALPSVSTDPRISDPKVSCEWLDGLRVIPWNSTHWVDQWGRDVWGLAYPNRNLLTQQHLPGGVIDVGKPTTGNNWRKTSLIHEILHILQGSIPAAPCAPNDDPHCGWDLPGGPNSVIESISIK